VPLALRGVQYRPASAAALLRRNPAVYGLGGLIAPFVGIKAIDLCLVALTRRPQTLMCQVSLTKISPFAGICTAMPAARRLSAEGVPDSRPHIRRAALPDIGGRSKAD
jgi:hypothetical protein